MLFAAGSAAPAFAQISAGLGAQVSASATTPLGGAGLKTEVKTNLVSRAKDRADQETTRRINALNTLRTRINAMTRISDSDKNGLMATIQAQIEEMNALRTRIAADADGNSTTSLKADIQSIATSYRIFALVIPQGAIEASADRAMNVASIMTEFANKLQARISEAQAAGANMSASVSVLADMNAKIADANAQAGAAINGVANLKPDNGDKTLMASNTAALKDARAKLKLAQDDLAAARKDAGIIVKAVIALKVSASSTTP